MIEVKTVLPDMLHEVWPIVQPMLQRSVEATLGDYNVDHMKVYILNKSLTLVVAVENNIIIGAGTLQIVNQPNFKVVIITATGGKGIANKEVFTQIEQWAKANGASKVRLFAKKSQARLYRLKLGLNSQMHVMEKSI
jgi:hypothetical protein